MEVQWIWMYFQHWREKQNTRKMSMISGGSSSMCAESFQRQEICPIHLSSGRSGNRKNQSLHVHIAKSWIRRTDLRDLPSLQKNWATMAEIQTKISRLI